MDLFLRAGRPYGRAGRCRNSQPRQAICTLETLEERRLLSLSPALVVGAAAGGAPRVTVLDASTGEERFSFLAYAEAFRGGVRVAMGDVNGDGTQDIITAAGAGGGPHVRVFSGIDRTELVGFFAYGPTFGGGVFVAAGDVNGDGKDDIITGAGAGGGPHVRVFSGANGSELHGFYAYLPAFGGGVHVAAGDVNGDGRADIVTGAGAGGGPHVRVWDAATRSELYGFYAYSPAFSGGVYVAAGDINGDGRSDIITGAGASGGPHVRVLDGVTRRESGSFFAFDSSYGRGVPVAVTNNQVFSVGVPGGLPLARAFGATGTLMREFTNLGADYRNGMYVAAGTLPLVDDPDDEYEDNESLSQAADLGTANSSRTWDLELLDEADWFRFRLARPGTSQSLVRLNFQHSAGDIDLGIYNSAGILVRRSDGVTNTEQVSLDGLAAGHYYVRVYGYRGTHNPQYSLTIEPPSGGSSGGGGDGTTGDGPKVLYVNFDGATISSSDLYRWAAGQWDPAWLPGGAANGVTVNRFFANRSDREQIISGILSRLEADLAPFGISVRRHSGLAVENVGATTLFAGVSTLTHPHVACDVDFGNNNSTDIAFIGEENWGSAANTILAMSDVFLHEAGHTYGLYHTQVVQNGALYSESMGLRYSSSQDQWLRDTAFMDRTFIEFRDANGAWHGPGGGQSQNSFQVMRGQFAGGAASPQASLATVDYSQAGMLIITAGDGADAIYIAQLDSHVVEVMINGQSYTVTGGLQNVLINTNGDDRDRIQIAGHLGFQLSISALNDENAFKLDPSQARVWNGAALNSEPGGLGCCCPHCLDAVDSILGQSDGLGALSAAVDLLSYNDIAADVFSELPTLGPESPIPARHVRRLLQRDSTEFHQPSDGERAVASSSYRRSAEDFLFMMDQLEDLLVLDIG